MRTWRQLSQTAARIDAEIRRAGADAQIVDTGDGDALVTVSAGFGLPPRDADLVLRAAVDAALLQMRRLGA
jgi:hypothetical protein